MKETQYFKCYDYGQFAYQYHMKSLFLDEIKNDDLDELEEVTKLKRIF